MKLILFFKKFNYAFLFGIWLGMAFVLFSSPIRLDNCSENKSISLSKEKSHTFRDLRSHKLKSPDLEGSNKEIFLSNQIAHESKSKDQNSQPFIRPRFYSTELGIKDKVLVSILSSLDSIETYGVSLNRTVRNYVDKLLFFIDGLGDHSLKVDLPVIGFKDSKPDIYIFRVLSYISENYLSKYEFFYFITDHSYIHGLRLNKLLKHISISQNVHMGLLSDVDSKFCSLDSGVILSRGLLRQLVPHLRWCAKNIKSSFPSANFGLCVVNKTNTLCSSVVQDLSYKSYSLKGKVDALSHLHHIEQNTFIKEALTLSELENFEDIFRIHAFYLQEHALSHTKEIIMLNKNVEAAMGLNSLTKQKNIWPPGSIEPNLPPTRYDVIRWDTFNATHFFLPNDFENTKKMDGADLYDIMNVVNASTSYLRSKLSAPLHFERIDYGYRRFDPTRGMDYILQLIFKDHITGNSILKRIKGYRGLTKPEFIPAPFVTENTPVTLIVFVNFGHLHETIQFLERVEKFKQIDHLTIMFSLIVQERHSDDPFKDLKMRIQKFSKKLEKEESRASWSEIHIDGKMPHPVSLLDLALRRLSRDSLVALIDHTAHFTPHFINRVCLNTVQNWQVFIPIPFVMYNPQVVEDSQIYASMQVSRRNGHFDKYNFDIISFYVSDYLSVRKSFSKVLPITHNEKELRRSNPAAFQLSLHQMFQKSNLNVLRAVEPELVLPYSAILCSDDLSKEESEICLRRRSLSYGLKDQLSKIVINYREA